MWQDAQNVSVEVHLTALWPRKMINEADSNPVTNRIFPLDTFFISFSDRLKKAIFIFSFKWQFTGTLI